MLLSKSIFIHLFPDCQCFHTNHLIPMELLFLRPCSPIFFSSVRSRLGASSPRNQRRRRLAVAAGLGDEPGRKSKGTSNAQAHTHTDPNCFLLAAHVQTRSQWNLCGCGMRCHCLSLPGSITESDDIVSVCDVVINGTLSNWVKEELYSQTSEETVSERAKGQTGCAHWSTAKHYTVLPCLQGKGTHCCLWPPGMEQMLKAAWFYDQKESICDTAFSHWRQIIIFLWDRLRWSQTLWIRAAQRIFSVIKYLDDDH